ncbi:TlpA disulfide reductase family protein [Tenacibaculum sp. IB213877]|uniref:TlpA family protein disulfide reductase n=1 Tax=Tenacibaculum sp. IB213877 TaxID=3097351 RepID=UPI002A5ADAB5|nr:TlpA disulfide reductase family protein [Tenacibaculum sp. IB213877]MDY0780151.1 TlpA disulfide reductase family protein [Tenacibaculum sp. IB213877]
MKKIILILVVVFFNCKTENPTQFSQKALNDIFISLDEKTTTFQEVINQYKGKKVLIDVWASWCGDCIKGLPKVVTLQNENPDVVFLFLSLDKNLDEWKTGIEKYNVNGEHYFMKSGWEGDFGSFLGLDWIPRYVVVDEKGHISMYKAVEANDSQILEALKK